jgi:signal transduction histidine kinase/CheY-like chemotaxis protein
MSKKPGHGQLEQKIADLEEQLKLSDFAMKQLDSYMFALHETALGILTELDLAKLLKNILQKASHLIGTDDGYIFIHAQKKDELCIKYGIGRFEKEIGFCLKPGEGLSGKVWVSGEPIIVDQYDTWKGRHKYSAWNGMSFDLGIPLKSGDKMIGVIGLCSYDKDKKVGKNEELILSRFADLASIAFYNAELHSRLRQELDQKIKIEKALKASHNTLNIILNSIDSTIYVSDLKTNEIIFMNKSMEDSFGGNFQGHKCYKVFRGETGVCDDCTNPQLVDKDNEPTDLIVWEGQNPITKKWYINYDRALKWIDGRMIKLQIASDITTLKSMEKERSKFESQLYQSQKMEAIGKLAGGIAHDFNNLLMGIQGCASLMMTEIGPSHPLFDHLKGIEEYVKSAADLTKQLLGFARGGKYEVLPTDINQVIENSSMLFGRTKKEITIHSKFQKDIWTVEVDQRQIEQVFLNLFVNAWQAMSKGGELYLQTENVDIDENYLKPYKVKPGRYVKISVTDTGMGMDGVTQQKIFDPFFTTKDMGRGTGLGLASAYGIIKNHDGFINVYSEVGQGTTFNIYLPASDKKVYRESKSERPLVMGSETILLVDDEDMIIKVGQAMLKKLGYHVVIARSGQEAVKAVAERSGTIDLVLLDLIMPGMDGGQTFDGIRDIQPQMPVLLSSGYAINGQAIEIMKRGCNGFIQKPFNLTQLSKHIRKVLDESERTDQG